MQYQIPYRMGLAPARNGCKLQILFQFLGKKPKSHFFITFAYHENLLHHDSNTRKHHQQYFNRLVAKLIYNWKLRRSARAVESASLERTYVGNGIKGSNPFSSAFARRSKASPGFGGRSP